MPNVDGGESLPSLSACVVTYERATHLARCLSALVQQASDILQVVVVDASRRAQRPDLGKSALQVTYIHAPDLAGWMTRSRNEALLHVEGDVIAFLDDDTVVHPGWARAIRRAFGETDAAALAGRTLNHQAGEERYERPIGRLLADGTLTDGFAADAPSRVEVDHGIGANMSFTRDVLAELGGFRDDYPGTALREDTDMFLRVKALGARVLYDPAVVVSHLPAPHVRGARFDTRYKLYGRRNHMVLLTRNRGMRSPEMRRWIAVQLRSVGDASDVRGKVMRLGIVVLGLGWGTVAALKDGLGPIEDPRRYGPAAEKIRARLRRP